MLQELIIAFICCGLCALPLFIIAFFSEHDNKPINFWAGDKSLKVDDVEGYNRSMATLYKRCALILIVTPVLIILHTYIFIGCGLNDPDIRLTLENYNFGFPGCRPHYFVSADTNMNDD